MAVKAKEFKASAVSPAYPREELLANAEALFNVKPEVMAGALYGSDQEEFTVEEMIKLVDSFLKRRIR